MLKKLPEEDFGPGIDFREYSIFDNPSLPSEVNNAMILVSLITILRFLIYLLCLNLFALVLEFRWKSHGLMFSSVKKELKIVMDHIIPLLEEYLNFQGIAMKKWYLIFFSSLYYISQIIMLIFCSNFSKSINYIDTKFSVLGCNTTVLLAVTVCESILIIQGCKSH